MTRPTEERYQGSMRQIYPAPTEPWTYSVTNDGGQLTVEVSQEMEKGGGTVMSLALGVQADGEGWCRTDSGQVQPFAWAWVGQELHLWLGGSLFIFQRANARRGEGAVDQKPTSGTVAAPMPGAVLEVLVTEGDQVERNQPLLVMESMKMELVIAAPDAGVVRRVATQPGQQVERGATLLELDSAPSGGAAPGEV